MADYDEKELILLVDDNAQTLRMLSDVLEKEGMSTLVALEANQGLHIARRMLPDLILLDAIMPSVDGFKMCQQLKMEAELRSIPVIFMTGLSDTDNVVKAFEVGGADYVTKPINTNELIARMRVHLANSKLALSVQCALDMAGQNMFATKADGSMSWATPQVSKKIDHTLMGDAYAKEEFHLQIKNWLAIHPGIGMNLSIVTSKATLKITLLGSTNAKEFLMKLHDNEAVDESIELKNNLHLTSREAEVLLWISRGKTNREIAQILGTSPRTINKHSDSIYKKLNVDNRTSAAAKALHFLEH